MNNRLDRQRGGSPILTIIVLAVLAYGIFVAIQYVPQWTEARAVQSILDSMQESQVTEPVRTQAEATAKVIRMLQVNELNDLTDSFQVKPKGNGFTVTFKYERDLNLGWETRTIHYERSVTL